MIWGESMSSEWLYRTSTTKATSEDTAALLDAGFVWRTPYADTSHDQLIANVQAVATGDVLHIMFRDGQHEPAYLGAFRVLDEPHDHAPERGPAALWVVRTGSPLEQVLISTGYGRDPRKGTYSGWHVEPIELGQGPPEVEFTGMNTLVRVRTTSELTGSAVGIDWSGSKEAGRKIWAARVEYARGSGNLASLDQPFMGRGPAGVAKRLGRWLREQKPFAVAGLDFCFGLAREDLQELGLRRGGPRELSADLASKVGPVASHLWDATRGAPERKRGTDLARIAPFAPTNLRMFRQTYWGIRALGGLDGEDFAILPWEEPKGRPAVIEVLPRWLANDLIPRCSYKGRSDRAAAERRALLEALVARFALTINGRLFDDILCDSEGDKLDAVMAAISALGAYSDGFSGVPHSAAQSGEGWIYSASDLCRGVRASGETGWNRVACRIDDHGALEVDGTIEHDVDHGPIVYTLEAG